MNRGQAAWYRELELAATANWIAKNGVRRYPPRYAVETAGRARRTAPGGTAGCRPHPAMPRCCATNRLVATAALTAPAPRGLAHIAATTKTKVTPR